MNWGRFTIRDFHNYGPRLTVEDVLVKSSNIGAAQIGLMLGAERQQAFFRKIGLFDASPVELTEAARTAPLLPKQWSELSTITISYGHGMAVTPLHLAAGYATLVNGGLRVQPSIIAGDARPTEADRVISRATSRRVREMLRQVVVRGTAQLADVKATTSAARPAPPTSRTPGAATPATRRSRPSPRSSRRRRRNTCSWSARRADGGDQQDRVPHRRADRRAGARPRDPPARAGHGPAPGWPPEDGAAAALHARRKRIAGARRRRGHAQGDHGRNRSDGQADGVRGARAPHRNAARRRLVGPLPEITGLSVDSRDARAGHLFAALPGTRTHGADFIPGALRMGAAAILTDPAGLARPRRHGPLDVPVIVSDHPRHALAVAASRWYGDQPEVMVAVTGTNGKTSVASFTRQIWEALGESGGQLRHRRRRGRGRGAARHTTPEPITLHRLLADLADKGVTHAAMEASSHGLDQRRLDGVRLAAAGFTNITRDHLDYHPDFEAYFRAKLALFERVLPRHGTAVVNLDDPHGPRVRRIAKARGQRLLDRRPGGGLRRCACSASASTPPGRSCSSPGAARATRCGSSSSAASRRTNALVAAGLAIGAGSDGRAVIGTLPALRTVRGRMERAATRANGRAGLRRLRPHAGRADDGADRAAAARDGAAHRRLRRRRRPRPRQAAADGRGGGGGGGRRLRHRRQPAHRGRGGDPRGGARGRARGDRDRRPRRGDPDRGRRAPARATRCSSPARATRPGR